VLELYEVKIRFYAPSPALSEYFLRYYFLETIAPEPVEHSESEAGSGLVEDTLFPEWGTFRIYDGSRPLIESRSGLSVSGTNFIVAGPLVEETRMSIGTARQWGVVLSPVGWAHIVAAPAADFANAVFDGHQHPAFERFRQLPAAVFADDNDPDAQQERLEKFLLEFLATPKPEEAQVRKIYEACLDPRFHTVGEFADHLGMSRRKLERLCKRHFGFAPKMLLRRQRFLRSLSLFTVDPTLKWIRAIDEGYHDQAQFVRDFKQFMGMTPRDYASLAKPILSVALRERDRFVRELADQSREWEGAPGPGQAP